MSTFAVMMGFFAICCRKRTEIRPEEVAVIQNFDYGTPGVYEVVYQITGADGVAGTATLIVVVSE